MTDFRSLLSNLRRPRLLIRAARFGMGDYCRDRDLRRVLSQSAAAGPATSPTPAPERTVHALLSAEERMEDIRRAGKAEYSVARHIEVLIALMAEVRLLPRSVAM